MVNLAQLQKELRLTIIIYYANFAAIFIYILVAGVLKQNKFAANIYTSTVNLGYLRYVFYFLSAAAISFILLSPKFFLINIEKIRNQEMFLAKLKIFSILRGSIAEIPAILGFILFLSLRWELDFHILCGISFITLIIFLPRQQAWEELLNKYPQLP
jgi:hypothetical protein